VAFMARCPNGHPIRAQEDFIGKRVRCPKCHVPFEVPHPDRLPSVQVVSGQDEDDEPVPPQEQDEAADGEERRERRARKKRNERRQALGRVRLGITLYLAGFLLSLLAIVAGVLAGFLGSRLPAGTPIAILLGLSAPATLLTLVGYILGLQIPSSSGGRGLILAALVMEILSLALALMSHWLHLELAGTMSLGLGRFVAWTASWLLWMLFLKALALRAIAPKSTIKSY